jgi:hypothetical protein
MVPPSSLKLCAALALMLAAPVPAGAQEDDYSAALCERALANGARRGGVPPQVLHAISLTETGRNSGGRLRPWPWAINREGKGFWFKTRDEALAFAKDSLAQGRRSFDVGCTQINYRWHGQAFSSLEQMFDPEATATYAAQFLRNLYEERGSWSEAAGAYHSLTPDLAAIYRKRFDRLLAGLDGGSLDGAGDMVLTASRASGSSRAERRAAERAEMVARIRAARDEPPPETVMGSMAAQAFEPASGGLLRGASSLLTQGGPLISPPGGSLF